MLKERKNLTSLISEVIADESIYKFRRCLVDTLADRLADDVTCIIEINKEDLLDDLERVDFHFESGRIFCINIHFTKKEFSKEQTNVGNPLLR